MRCAARLLAVMVLFAGCEARPVPVVTPPVSVTASTPVTPESAPQTSSPAVERGRLGDPAADTQPATTPGDTTPALIGSTAEAPATALAEAASAGKPVVVADGVVTLSPENTKIQFVGTHSPPKQPEPRVGGFAKFSGKAEVDADGKLKSVTVDIDTTSLFTPIEKLTNHLKSPDFFEVREHPTAKFESTKITPGEGGETVITGNLTLHGVTKEISFPATVEVTGSGLTLESQFDLDRTQFGMTFGKGQVENKVSMTVVVGEKTAAK